jgi:hypothetical protein
VQFRLPRAEEGCRKIEQTLLRAVNTCPFRNLPIPLTQARARMAGQVNNQEDRHVEGSKKEIRKKRNRKRTRTSLRPMCRLTRRRKARASRPSTRSRERPEARFGCKGRVRGSPRTRLALTSSGRAAKSRCPQSALGFSWRASGSLSPPPMANRIFGTHRSWGSDRAFPPRPRVRPGRDRRPGSAPEARRGSMVSAGLMATGRRRRSPFRRRLWPKVCNGSTA